MTIIDTIHSGGMHCGMKIARPLHMSQGPEEAKLILTPGVVSEKDSVSNLDSSSRPGLAIRRRFLICQSEEADDHVAGSLAGLTPARLNQANAATTTRVNHSHREVDQSSKQCVVRSSSTSTTTTQDQCPPVTKSPKKMMRLFDLNMLPTVHESVWSPGSSPSSTIESADSTTHRDASTLAMVTKAVFFSGSPPSTKRFREEGGALAADLGLLSPVLSLPSIEADSLKQQFAYRDPQPWEADCADVPTPGRKRLRKLSECAGGRSGSTSMSKSWTAIDGDGGNHREDFTKTLSAVSQADAKGRRPDVVDDDVCGAVAALLLLSSSPRRDFPFSSTGEVSSSGRRAFADSPKDEEGRRDAGICKHSRSSDLAASDSEDPSKSSGSGSSVLLRPKNKHRYRSMAEIIVQTRVLSTQIGQLTGAGIQHEVLSF